MVAVEFACSSCDCVGFLKVPWLPPTFQRHAGYINWRLKIACRCEYECEWFLVSVCWLCDRSAGIGSSPQLNHQWINSIADGWIYKCSGAYTEIRWWWGSWQTVAEFHCIIGGRPAQITSIVPHKMEDLTTWAFVPKTKERIGKTLIPRILQLSHLGCELALPTVPSPV